MKPPTSTKALFLDRDGTLIYDMMYLCRPELVTLIPGVRESLRWFQEQDWLLFLFSNQSGVERGYYTLEEAQACTQRMIDLLDLTNPLFTQICLATELPSEQPRYRKPSPRFILECLEMYHLNPQNCWMVGDQITDVQAGLAAHVHAAQLIPSPSTLSAHLCFPDLLHFQKFIEKSKASFLQ